MTIKQRQNNTRRYITAIVMLVAVIATAFVPQTSEAKSKLMPRMYAFGFALALDDSVAYITNVTTVDSVWVDEKTSFVINRADYTQQLKSYLAVADLSKTMTVVTFAKTQKAAQKKADKLLKRYSNTKKRNYKVVRIDGFMLESVAPMNLELERKANALKIKKGKKEHQKKVKEIVNQ